MTDSGVFYLNPAHRMPADLVEGGYPVLVDLTGTLGGVPTEPSPRRGGGLRAVALAAVAALALAGGIAVFIAHHPVDPASAGASSPLPAAVPSASTVLLFDRFLELRVPVAAQPDPSPEPSPRSSWVRVRAPEPARSAPSRSWSVEPDPRAGVVSLDPLPPDPARWPCPAAFPQWCRPGGGLITERGGTSK